MVLNRGSTACKGCLGKFGGFFWLSQWSGGTLVISWAGARGTKCRTFPHSKNYVSLEAVTPFYMQTKKFLHGLGIIFQEYNYSVSWRKLYFSLFGSLSVANYLGKKNHTAYSSGSPSLHTSSISISQELVRMQILRLTPNLLSQKCRGWGPAICVLTSHWVTLMLNEVWEPLICT